MFSIKEILQATQGQLVQGTLEGKVNAVCIDSRLVKPGELFIAVKGDVFDGHDFIDSVIKKGVRVVVVHQQVRIEDQHIRVIQVPDTTKALGNIARFHRQRFKLPVIALTGSAGKTTTKEMIAAVLSRKYKVLKNEGTQNNHIGVPLTLLKLQKTHQVLVLECGTNQPGDIIWLADVARPEIALFTNIGEAHLEKLKSKAGVLKEKWTLTSFMKVGAPVIINADDPLLAKQVAGNKKFKIIRYGIHGNADCKASDVEIIEGRRLSWRVDSKKMTLNSCGISNVYNALAAVGIGRLLKVSFKEIIIALDSFVFPQGRGQIVPLGSGWMINDTYNANPVSMRLALQTLKAIATKQKRILVAGDMLELGNQAEALHRSIGLAAAAAGVDVIIAVGPLAKLIGTSAKARQKKIQVFACRDIVLAQKHLAKIFTNGDAVLIKGSRRMRMEEAAEFLLASPKGVE